MVAAISERHNVPNLWCIRHLLTSQLLGRLHSAYLALPVVANEHTHHIKVAVAPAMLLRPMYVALATPRWPQRMLARLLAVG